MSEIQKTIPTPVALAIIAAFLTGVLVCWVFLGASGNSADANANSGRADENASPINFTRPIIPDMNQFLENSALEKKINSLIESAISQHLADDVSVYFRDQPSGKWISVNPDKLYSPASLLKVPLMIAYFRLAENDPSAFSKNLTYDGKVDYNSIESFKSPNDIKPGTYSVANLIRSMIADSDNNATSLLENDIDKKSLKNVYTDLGVSTLDEQSLADNTSVSQYANFFRVLYNATYLSRQDSEKALQLMSITDFPQGIRATVPADIVVAQKFGERTLTTASGATKAKELHDCGIVYYPKNPYLFCVMTRGSDFDKLTQVIQMISKKIYSEVDSKYADL